MQCTSAAIGLLLCQICAATTDITNAPVIIDMVQNNPGDAVAWQQSKYFDARVLKAAGYTGQTTTGEVSGTMAVDFSSTGLDFFPSGSKQRLWLDAYAKGVERFVEQAHDAEVKAYFFVDLLVFPTFVVDAYPNITGSDGKIEWNEASRQLLAVLVNETFKKFPGCDGWIVRTGETYTYDTPYHVGNTPNPAKTVEGWADFATTLREMVCVQQNKQLFFRSWDNWPSEAAYYLKLTDRVPTHPLLYFSVKHSAGDFVRPAVWNPTLGIGKHAQIVEVELQREYEGKGAHPNYVMDGIIDGFKEMDKKVGLKDVIHSPQIKGLWTWTRGGGWWGPYLHGNEQWIDLHFQVLSRWWAASGSKTEAQVFAEVTPILLLGCADDRCLSAFRNFSQSAADVVLHGLWGEVSSCGDWMRDDRIGGVDRLGCLKRLGNDDAKWAASLQEKTNAAAIAVRNVGLYTERIGPQVTGYQLRQWMLVSAEYSAHLYTIVAAAWPLLQHAYRLAHSMPPIMKPAEVAAQIEVYDGAFGAYRAFGLGNVHAPSLYHDYYLCLGTTCNGGFNPPASDMQQGSYNGKNAYGVGHTVDQLRNSSRIAVTF
jgi:hypothetical protein